MAALDFIWVVSPSLKGAEQEEVGGQSTDGISSGSGGVLGITVRA